MISCIHLEKQTKDILKWKSVSKYNHQGRGETSKLGGGGGGGGHVGGFYLKFEKSVIIIIKLFVIDLHCHTKFQGKRGGGLWVLPQKIFTLIFEALRTEFLVFSKVNLQTNWM